MNASIILIIGNYRISVGGERWEIKLFCYGQLDDKVRNIEARDELRKVLNVKVNARYGAHFLNDSSNFLQVVLCLNTYGV